MGLTVASDVLTEARSVYLNDPNGSESIDSILLPHLRTAHSLLECELQANGCQTINEEALATIPANTNEYNPLPADLAMPKMLYERAANTNDEWRPMTYKNNIPQVTAGPFLQFWSYRVDRIFFLPATNPRQVKLLYQRSFPLSRSSDPREIALIHDTETYLASKTAAFYLLFIRQNPTLAKVADDIATAKLADIINQQVQLMQAAPVRRKGYMPYRNS